MKTKGFLHLVAKSSSLNGNIQASKANPATKRESSHKANTVVAPPNE